MERIEVRLSVLIPAHNASRTIFAALSSSLLSLPRNSEILVFFDGEMHTSWWTNLLLRSKRIRAIRSKTRVGLVSALNRLVSEANGEFVARMDADDIALPFRYVLGLRSVSTGKADAAFTQSILFFPKIPFLFIPQVLFALNKDQANWHLLVANPFVHPALVTRKKLLQEVGGYRECVAEDLDLWLRIAASGKTIIRHPWYGVLYRVHHSQISASMDFEERVNSDPKVSESYWLLAEHLGLANGRSEIHSLSLLAREKLLTSSQCFRLQEKYLRPLLDSVSKFIRKSR